MPQMNEAPKLPIALHQCQTCRQRGLSLFSRHSNETTRMIRNTSTSSSAM